MKYSTVFVGLSQLFLAAAMLESHNSDGMIVMGALWLTASVGAMIFGKGEQA